MVSELPSRIGPRSGARYGSPYLAGNRPIMGRMCAMNPKAYGPILRCSHCGNEPYVDGGAYHDEIGCADCEDFQATGRNHAEAFATWHEMCFEDG